MSSRCKRHDHAPRASHDSAPSPPKFPIEFFGKDALKRGDLTPGALKKNYVNQRVHSNWEINEGTWNYLVKYRPGSAVGMSMSSPSFVDGDDTLGSSICPTTQSPASSPYETPSVAITPPTIKKRTRRKRKTIMSMNDSVCTTLSPLEKFEASQKSLGTSKVRMKKTTGYPEKAVAHKYTNQTGGLRILQKTNEMQQTIEKEAWEIARRGYIQHFKSMWAGDLAKVIALPRTKVDGYYDTIVTKVQILQRAWRLFSWWRRTTQKFDYLVSQRRQKEDHAATYIQAWYRAIIGWRDVQVRIWKRNTRCSTCIERIVRGHLGRERVKRLRKRRIRAWIKAISGVKHISKLPCATAWGDIGGGITYSEKLKLVDLSSICFRRAHEIKYRNLESAEHAIQNIAKKVLRRRKEAKARKQSTWNVVKNTLFTAKKKYLGRIELGIRKQHDLEQMAKDAYRAEVARERHEREQMHAEWEHDQNLKRILHGLAVQSAREEACQAGLERARIAHLEKQENEVKAEEKKVRMHKDRWAFVQSIKIYEAMYLSGGRGMMYMVPRKLLPSRLTTSSAVHESKYEGPTCPRRKRALDSIAQQKTVHLPYRVVGLAMQHASEYWPRSQHGRKRIYDLPPRFLRRNVAVERLARRIDTVTVAQAVAESSVKKVLHQMIISRYTKEIIERHMGRSLTNVAAKIVIAQILPKVTRKAAFKSGVRAFTRQLCTDDVLGQALRNVERKYQSPLEPVSIAQEAKSQDLPAPNDPHVVQESQCKPFSPPVVGSTVKLPLIN